MTNKTYFLGANGTRYAYADIAARIRAEAPHTLGQHIFVQLEAIGLLEEMQNGSTPFCLPYTFAKSTSFNIQHLPHCPDRAMVTVDNRFHVALIRTEDGLSIDVYPITGGETWDDPCDRFEVDEEDIRALERELGDD